MQGERSGVAMLVLSNLSIATMVPGQQGYGLVTDGVIVVERETILWCGKAEACPQEFLGSKYQDCGGRLATPALLDCHTHLVHGGNRAREFEMRLNGMSYEEIARSGGGIVSTVSATRKETEEQLLKTALRRVDALIGEGVATIEIKSGYGLDTDTELKMLRVARRISALRPVEISSTFLGAHAVPAGMDADHYIDDVCIPALVKAHGEGLVDAVDGFCETIGFGRKQIERVFDKAAELGIPVKLHAEQLSHSGGTCLATQFHALSADHVEYANEEDAASMARAGTVAVLLPGAFYFLHETRKPPIAEFRNHGVGMALATDWNPGSSPMGSLLLAMNMACTLFQLTPEEALAGTTREAARALGLTDRGMIMKGMRADLAIWDVAEPAELSFNIGFNPLHKRIFEGRT